MNTKVYLKTFILILIVTIIFLFSTTVYSESNYSVTMTLSGSSQIREGETITLVASLSSVNAGDGVEAFSASLNYDSSIYEYVSVSGNNNWRTSFDTSSNMIIGFNGSKISNSQSVFTVTLKVREGISVDSTSVTIQNIQFSGGAVSNGGSGDIYVASTGTSFDIIKNEPVINEEIIQQDEEEIERQVEQTTRNLDYTNPEETQLEQQEEKIEEVKQDGVVEEIKIAKENFPKTLTTSRQNEQSDTTHIDYRIPKTVRTTIAIVGVAIVLILGYKLFEKTKMIIF